MTSPSKLTPGQTEDRAGIIGGLRALLPKLEGLSGKVLSFGSAALDGHLPHGGLPLAGLHEIVPGAAYDLAAAFGFLTALLARLPPGGGPVLIIAAQPAFDGCGRPYGHGLAALGLDPSRVVLVEPREERQGLWAMEEALRSAVPSAVVGIIGKTLDLKSSQKLQRAARTSGVPLLLLRSQATLEASAAVTRWRIGAAGAARNRFGLIARWRWRACLERCRNGNPGEWLVEWDHDARCFRLAAALADPAFLDRAGEEPFARAG
jgi:protein ImuA